MIEVPIIDFAPFLCGDGKAEVARAVCKACEETGFFYIKNHGVAPAMTDAILLAGKRFFALPGDVKAHPDLLISPTQSRGYQPLGARHYPDTVAPDLMEAFKYQRELPPDDPELIAGDRIQQANKWPQDLPGWRETLVGYFEAVDGVAAHLLRAFALALQLEETFFLEFYRKPMTQVSLLHYPAQPPRDGAYGNRPHVDETAFTIVLQGEVSGLEVETQPGEWAAAAPVEGTFVVNIGNLMARWTNDRFRSTMHRVVNRSGAERYSTPYFAIPDFDAVVTCAPTCQGPGNPAKYEPLHVGHAIQKKFSSDYVG
jgi:isopenicillin N synthase-like dioxygenase